MNIRAEAHAEILVQIKILNWEKKATKSFVHDKIKFAKLPTERYLKPIRNSPRNIKTSSEP